MDRGFFAPFEAGRETRRERFDRRERKPGSDHLFLWTVFILLLIGAAMASWLGTFSVFGHPERPYAYRILRKIKKVDPPQRFKLNAAPAGKFQNAEDHYHRFAALSDFDLRQANLLLLRDYIRNFQSSNAAIPYLMGRFSILQVFPLASTDLFPSGAVVLAASNDQPQLLIEFILPASPAIGGALANVVTSGMEIELKRTYDLSAVIHAARLPDQRIQLTVVPLAYGAYALRKAGMSFALEPPAELLLENEWPVVKDERREAAERRFTNWRLKAGLGPLVARTKDTPPAADAKPAPDVLASTDAAPARGARPKAAAPAAKPATASATPPASPAAANRR